MKSNQFQCAHCEEVRTVNRYIPDNQKVKVIVCVQCLADHKERELSKAAVRNAADSTYAPRLGNHGPSRTIAVHEGDRKSIKASNEAADLSFENFKKAYRSIDIGILAQSSYLPESSINSDIRELSADALDSEIKSTVALLNQLRSARYHIARKAAFDEHQSFIEQMNEIRRREKEAKLQKNREAVGKKLRGAARRIYKRTGMLPIEFLAELREKGIIPKDTK